MDAGFSFCRTDDALKALRRREGRLHSGAIEAKAELTTDSGSLKAFGRRSVASSLYIGGTEVLYIGTGGVLTSYLYI